jgi:Domain of unknown function (DUF222)/HNH endonuclease
MLVDDLRALVEGGELGPRIGGLEDVVEVRRLLDRIEGEWFAALHECDVRGDSQAVAALSTGDYLARKCRRTAREGRELVTTAKRLRWAENVGAGLRAGSVSLGQAKAFTRELSKRNISLFAEHEDMLLDLADELSVDQLEQAMKHWRRRADSELLDKETKDTEAGRELFVSQLGDSEWVVKGSLTAEQGCLVSEAVNAVVEAEWEGTEEKRTLPQRRSDALATICRTWLTTNHDVSVHATRPHLQVHVQLDDLLALGQTRVNPAETGPTFGGYTNEGSFFDGATVARLWCDSVISRVFMHGSILLEAGRPSRNIPAGLRRVVHGRDQHCRYPGCTCKGAWCEVHHIIEWNKNGEHSIKNLVLLCPRHHHRIHQLNETLILLDDGTLIVITVLGEERMSHPPPDIGRLFVTGARKRDRTAITDEQTRRRINAILRALRDSDLMSDSSADGADNVDNVDGDEVTAGNGRANEGCEDSAELEPLIEEPIMCRFVPGRFRPKPHHRKPFPGLVLHYRHEIVDGVATLKPVA